MSWLFAPAAALCRSWPRHLPLLLGTLSDNRPAGWRAGRRITGGRQISLGPIGRIPTPNPRPAALHLLAAPSVGQSFHGARIGRQTQFAVVECATRPNHRAACL